MSLAIEDKILGFWAGNLFWVKLLMMPLVAGIIKILYVGFVWGFDLLTSILVFSEMFVIVTISYFAWMYFPNLKGGKKEE